MKFDMGAAWSDGLARVSANRSLLAILGGVFFFVPAVVMYLAMPDMMDMMMVPGGDPEAMTRAFEAAMPRFFILYFFVMLISLVGYSAMIALLGDRGRISVGDAIAVGFRALVPLLGILVLLIVAYLLFAVVVGVIFGLLVAAFGAVSTSLAYGVAVLLGIALFVLVLVLLTRLSLVLPAVVLERTSNPIAALRRSWALTRLAQWRLVGFYILFFIAYVVVALVLFMVMGLIAAAAAAPAVLGFLNGLVGAAAAVILSGLLVGIYRQLAGPSADSVSETFS